MRLTKPYSSNTVTQGRSTYSCTVTPVLPQYRGGGWVHNTVTVVLNVVLVIYVARLIFAIFGFGHRLEPELKNGKSTPRAAHTDTRL